MAAPTTYGQFYGITGRRVKRRYRPDIGSLIGLYGLREEKKREEAKVAQAEKGLTLTEQLGQAGIESAEETARLARESQAELTRAELEQAEAFAAKDLAAREKAAEEARLLGLTELGVGTATGAATLAATLKATDTWPFDKPPVPETVTPTPKPEVQPRIDVTPSIKGLEEVKPVIPPTPTPKYTTGVEDFIPGITDAPVSPTLTGLQPAPAPIVSGAEYGALPMTGLEAPIAPPTPAPIVSGAEYGALPMTGLDTPVVPPTPTPSPVPPKYTTDVEDFIPGVADAPAGYMPSTLGLISAGAGGALAGYSEYEKQIAKPGKGTIPAVGAGVVKGAITAATSIALGAIPVIGPFLGTAYAAYSTLVRDKEREWEYLEDSPEVIEARKQEVYGAQQKWTEEMGFPGDPWAARGEWYRREKRKLMSSPEFKRMASYEQQDAIESLARTRHPTIPVAWRAGGFDPSKGPYGETAFLRARYK